MSKLAEDIEAWFKERPIWLQDAASRFIEHGGIKESDIHELTLICKKESGLIVEGETIPEPRGIPESSLLKSESSNQVHLLSITNPVGINALNPRNPLEFGKFKLTVIYGRNSAGKSGYVRILKHACGARSPGHLHQNIASEIISDQGCRFKYLINHEHQEVDWMVADGIQKDLSLIELYDTVCADVYVNEENEISYEPGILALFRDLTALCDRIKENIEKEIVSKSSKLPPIPSNLNTTDSCKWVSNLNHKVTTDEINNICEWTDQVENEYSDIKKRLAEPDPKAKAASLRRTKTNVDNLTKLLKNLKDTLSQSNCEEYIKARNDAIIKKRAATIDAKKIFESTPLNGVGSETWKLLWEQARKYSELEAYNKIIFPNTEENARCVLCHQILDEDAKNRFKSFEKYVKGGLEKDADDAEIHLSDLKEKIGEVPTVEEFDLLLDSGGIDNEEERKKFQDLREELEKRKEKLLNASKADELLDIKGVENIVFLENLFRLLEKQAIAYENDAIKDNRLNLQKQALEYEAKKWVHDQKEKIVDDVNRLLVINKLEEAKKLTSTYALSMKKSELADVLITTAFKNRFDEEVKKLGAKYIGVQLIKTKTEKGRVFHRIVLSNNKQGVPTAEILSEGEFRIVSLAAFLADVEGRDSKSTFIFDDPITSLDQDYEEATVNRLVELSKSRQVIVFTHRLSMLALLEDAAGRNDIAINVIGLQRESWGAGEPRQAPLPAQKPKTAINTLIDRVTKARKVLNESGREQYDILGKSICSDLRITLERIIELDLMADVIQRFRRDVHTKNKLHKLAKVTIDDCSYIEGLMTKYSAYEHSQPAESPIVLPEPDELEGDLKKLNEWRDEFEGRTA